MAKFAVVCFSDRTQALVAVEFHGVCDWRASVDRFMSRAETARGCDELIKLWGQHRVHWTQLHAMDSETGALAEAVVYLASERARFAHVTEVVCQGHLFRDAPMEGSRGQELQAARERLQNEREAGEELRDRLRRAGDELALAVTLTTRMAAERDAARDFVAALPKGGLS